MSDLPDILVVDDDDVLRERVARALRDRGHEVRTAASLAEVQTRTASASAPAVGWSPEWALVDLRLPDGSGLEAVRLLLAVDPHTRVVVLTGYGSIPTAMEAVRAGAFDYIQKPTTVATILRAFEGARPDVPSDMTEPPTPSLARNEWEYLHRVLEDVGGNVSEAARRLKIHRRSLQRKLQKHPPKA